MSFEIRFAGELNPIFLEPYSSYDFEARKELNPCIEVLQTPALPLRHRAFFVRIVYFNKMSGTTAMIGSYCIKGRNFVILVLLCCRFPISKNPPSVSFSIKETVCEKYCILHQNTCSRVYSHSLRRILTLSLFFSFIPKNLLRFWKYREIPLFRK